MELIRSGHRLGPCDDTGGADKDAAPLLNFHPWGNKMGETRQVLVPDIGDFKDVPIIEIQVKPGDRITAEAPLITLESDKASMEVPSPSAGVVKNIAVKLGDRVSQGAPILTLEVMKMEQTLRAPFAGVLKAIKCKVGDIVQEGVELAEIEAAG